MTKENDNKIEILQSILLGFAGIHLKMFDKMGVTRDAGEIKSEFDTINAQMQINQNGFETPDEPFLHSSRLLNCADWKVEKEDGQYNISTNCCKMVGMCRQLETSDPCSIYCLEPMFKIVKILDPDAEISTERTLFRGDSSCTIRIRSNK